MVLKKQSPSLVVLQKAYELVCTAKSMTDIYEKNKEYWLSVLKQINVTNGIVKANVTKNQSSDFQLVSPTSVAAVKGTDFWGVIDENTGDKFCGLSGKVEVTNSATGQMVELLANTTAVSLKNGSFISYKSNNNTLAISTKHRRLRKKGVTYRSGALV